MSQVLNRYYVPQLDGLRFFAFFLVFIHHYKLPQGVFVDYPLLVDTFSTIQEFGWAGVDLFLVLSAFLITNLLLLEYDRTGTLSLKDFYVRRSLRIWPLYYFMLVIGFLVSPLLSGKFDSPPHQQMISDHLLSYSFFLGNFSAGFNGYADSRFLAHLWTISLEEQFYLVWPVLLVLLVRYKRLLSLVLLSLMILSVLIRYICWASGYPAIFIWTNIFTRLDPLVLGTFLALYRCRHEANGSGDLFKYIVGCALIIIPMLFPNIDSLSGHIIWQYFSIALGFCLILDGSLAGKIYFPHVILTNRLIVWLGKLCYGLYVYHLLGINLGKKIAAKMTFLPIGEVRWFLGLLLSLAITIVIAHLSYNLFEKKFLILKKKFTIIESRPA